MQRHPSSSVPDESVFLRALEILQRRWKVGLAVLAAVLAAAVSFSLYLPDLYRATAVVLVERQLPDMLVRPVVTDDIDSRLHVIKQEILSRNRLTDLVHRFQLYADLRKRNDMDTVLDQMRQDIGVQPTGPELISGRTKTVAFNLTYTGTDRETVDDVTNAIAAFYVAQNNQIRSAEAQRSAQFLKTQVDEAKQQLDRHELAVGQFTKKHLGALPQQVEVNLASLERLNGQLRSNGERQLAILEQRQKLLEAVPPPAPQKLTPAASRLERAKQELQDLRANFNENYPDVRRLKDEVATLEQEVARTAAATPPPAPDRTGVRTTESLNAELDALKRDEKTLRESVAALERRLDGLPYRQNELATISRDHQAAKDLYESLLRRYEEAQLASSMESTNQGERFRVLEQATAPVGPSAPNRLRLLAMGLLVAVLLAGIVVLLMEQVDSSFHTVDDVRAFTGIPVLVSIPAIGGRPAGHWRRAAVTTTCVLGGLLLIGLLAAYLARDNEQLVRMLFQRA